MARVPYVTRSELPEEHQHLFDVDGEEPDDTHNHAHQVMANDPQLFTAWSEWAWALYEAVDDARVREFVILAVASALECRYVWQQHVPLAREWGISTDEIVAISAGDHAAFSAAESAVLAFGTALITGSVDDETHRALARHYTDREIVALGPLASEYLQLGTVLAALAVELEEEFVGWDRENDHRIVADRD